MKLGSLLTAMVTPFDENLELDLQRARSLASSLVDSGSDGIVVCGSTGEAATLTGPEKIALTQAVVEAVGSRASVIAGTGTNSTKATIELTKAAEAAGAHAALVVTPYYNKPTSEGIVRHMKAVASETKLPILLYNIPGRTAVRMSADTMAQLSHVDNIVGVKDSTQDMDLVSETIHKSQEGFLVYSGDDSLLLPHLSLGCVGVVTVISHLACRHVRELINAALQGDLATARKRHYELFPLTKAVFSITNPIGIKYALAETGQSAGGVRPPLCEPDEATKERIRRALNEFRK